MHRTLSAALGIAAAALLVGCSAIVGSTPVASFDPDADLGMLPRPVPLGEVTVQAMVLDDGDGAELCLGGVAESYPPQCGGTPIPTWDWAIVDGWDEANGVRFGDYVLQGTWTDDAFTPTATSVANAIYTPADAPPTPSAPAPAASREQLETLAQRIADALGDRALSWDAADRIDITVVYDDRSLQEHFDDVLGEGAVVVTSALTDVTP